MFYFYEIFIIHLKFKTMAKGAVKNFSNAHLHIKARGSGKAAFPKVGTPAGPKKVGVTKGVPSTKSTY